MDRSNKNYWFKTKKYSPFFNQTPIISEANPIPYSLKNQFLSKHPEPHVSQQKKTERLHSRLSALIIY